MSEGAHASALEKMSSWYGRGPELSESWKTLQILSKTWVPAMLEEATKEVDPRMIVSELPKKTLEGDNGNLFALLSDVGLSFEDQVAYAIAQITELQKEQLAAGELRTLFGLPIYKEGEAYTYRQVYEAYLQLAKDEIAAQEKTKQEAALTERLIHDFLKELARIQLAVAKRLAQIDAEIKANERSVEKTKTIAGGETQLVDLMREDEFEPTMSGVSAKLLQEKNGLEDQFGKIGRFFLMFDQFEETTNRTIAFESGRTSQLTPIMAAA